MLTYPLSISFGEKGDYKLWAGEGWHHDDSDKSHTWTSHVADIRLPLPRSRTPLLLELDLIPKGDDQDVFVYLNGAFAAFWRIDRAEKMSSRISPMLLRPGENSLTIVCPRAVRPQDPEGGDQRVLGVAVRSLGLSESIA
jgi:hypothetical protein